MGASISTNHNENVHSGNEIAINQSYQYIYRLNSRLSILEADVRQQYTVSISTFQIRFEVNEIYLTLQELLAHDSTLDLSLALHQSARKLAAATSARAIKIDKYIVSFIFTRYFSGRPLSKFRPIGALEVPGTIEWMRARTYIHLVAHSSTLKARPASVGVKEKRPGMDDCAICMEPFLFSEAVITLPCHPSHQFHQICISKIVKSDAKLACPICRGSMER